MGRKSRNVSEVANSQPPAKQSWLYDPSEVRASLRSAKSELSSLAKVTKLVDLMPENLKAEAFDIFNHHLRKPTNSLKHHPGQRENGLSPTWFIASLMGMNRLGISFFNRDEIHKRKFTGCWPNIIKWLTEILDGGHIRGEEHAFYHQVPGVLEVAYVVRWELLDDKKVVDVAVRLWNGHYSVEGTNYFAVHPLLQCISLPQAMDSNRDPSYVLKSMSDHGNKPQELVDKLLVRLAGVMVQSTPMDIHVVLALLNMTVQLPCMGYEPLCTAILSPRIGRALTIHAKQIINELDAFMSKEHFVVARQIFRIIKSCISNGHAEEIVKAGFLPSLLRMAQFESVDSTVDWDPDSSRVKDPMSVDALNLLYRALFTMANVASVCRNEFSKLYTSDLCIESFLKETPKDFQTSWASFENLLLDQLVLVHLFKIGYAPEDASCSNRDCQTTGLREIFKKCAGCYFALYCSRTCQRADWVHHRIDCKKIDEKTLNAVSNANSRLTRRTAALLSKRHLDDILSLGQTKHISRENMAFYVNGPFEVDIFDYREIFNESDSPPILIMAANHLACRRGQGENLVLYSMADTMMVPCITRLDDRWTKEIGTITGEQPMKNQCDEKGNPFVRNKADALRVCAHLCRTYASETGQPVWSESVIQRAANAVITSFTDSTEES